VSGADEFRIADFGLRIANVVVEIRNPQFPITWNLKKSPPLRRA